MKLFILTISVCVANFSWGFNVFGPDKREAITSTKYPWRTIGYLDGLGCTGTLVGKSLVLTAAHCVIDPYTQKLRSNLGSFRPNYINGSSMDSASIEYVYWGTNNPDLYRENDWAILVLDEPIGKTYGWMGVTNYISGTVNTAGYSYDFKSGQTAGVHRSCSLVTQVGSLYTHNCHTARGSSGGPIFTLNSAGNPSIVALNVAERRGGGEKSLHLAYYEDGYSNIAVMPGAFLPRLEELRGKE